MLYESSCEEQIAGGEQFEELRPVLGEAAVAALNVTELALESVKGCSSMAVTQFVASRTLMALRAPEMSTQVLVNLGCSGSL